MEIKNAINETYNNALTACIKLARYRAQVVRESVASLGLKGLTPNSKEYLIRTDEQIKTLMSIAESFERLKT